MHSFPPLGAMPPAPISAPDAAWLASLPPHQRGEAEWTLRACAAASGMTEATAGRRPPLAQQRAAAEAKIEQRKVGVEMSDQPESLFLAAHHMVEAIDRGYFADDFLPQSAFTAALREAVARERLPKLERIDVTIRPLNLSAWPAMAWLAVEGECLCNEGSEPCSTI